jgi:hypothetical protein
VRLVIFNTELVRYPVSSVEIGVLTKSVLHAPVRIGIQYPVRMYPEFISTSVEKKGV